MKFSLREKQVCPAHQQASRLPRECGFSRLRTCLLRAASFAFRLEAQQKIAIVRRTSVEVLDSDSEIERFVSSALEKHLGGDLVA